MHQAQAEVNLNWLAEGLPPFLLGIGISTGDVAAALLGSEERLEYSLVGDAVNLAQRLQQWGEGGQTVLSDPTYAALVDKPVAERIEPALVKGRQTPVGAYRLGGVANPGFAIDLSSGEPLI
jgi:class 3 adenylate cyclase